MKTITTTILLGVLATQLTRAADETTTNAPAPTEATAPAATEAPTAQAAVVAGVETNAPVLLPNGSAAHSKSGLAVVVQSDYRSVVQPARQLGNQLLRFSFWMFVVIVAVSLALWYIVVRMFREESAGLKRSATPVPESTPLHGMTTIPATRRERR